MARAVTDDRVVRTSADGSADGLTVRYAVDDDERPSRALVTVLSAISDTTPTELGPVGDHVDLEAVDELLVPEGDPGAFGPSVLLTVDGFRVVLTGSEVVVTDRPDGEDRTGVER